MRWKRALILTHRWAGIGLCALFAPWFLSGIFMMYVEFPELTAPERRAGEQALDFSEARLSPGEAIQRLSAADFCVVGDPNQNHTVEGCAARAGAAAAVADVKLGMRLGRPIYAAVGRGGFQPRVVYADSGEVLRSVDVGLAREVAIDFARRSRWLTSVEQLRTEGEIQTDQWTVSSAMNPYRPLYKFSLADDKGTELYVSSTTAEVVRVTRHRERVANYFAAVTHWIYPTILRRHVDAWTWVIDISSGACALFALTGPIVGVVRWRWHRPPRTSPIPYRGWLRWHFITGALFGVLALTWVFSGLLSMNPGKINRARQPTRSESRVFSGQIGVWTDFQMPSMRRSQGIVEARLLRYGGSPFYEVSYRDGRHELLAGSSGRKTWPTAGDVQTRLPQLMPTVAVADVSTLQHFDAYYYTRHPEYGERPLPVIRVRFADPDSTWFYVDPVTGQVVERLTKANRWYRWLYNGLHSFDFPWLWNRRPLWDIVVIALSLGGLSLSVLGVVVGVRRLRYEIRVASSPAKHIPDPTDDDLYSEGA